MNTRHPIVTLTTDFGLEDEYAGGIKGVLLSHNSAIHIVDITHRIPRHDIHAAAHLLSRSYRYFPAGTVHLVVVDPGVGSARAILALSAGGQFFVGPDNGIFTPVFRDNCDTHVHRVTNDTLFLPGISNTFHGRDIMAPVAARLATGLPVTAVGPQISSACCTHLPSTPCTVSQNTFVGEVVAIDHFGNLLTNIKRDDLEKWRGSSSISIEIKNISFSDIHTAYSDCPSDHFLTLYDSHDFLEIACNGGHAAHLLQLTVGTPVSIRKHRPTMVDSG